MNFAKHLTGNSKSLLYPHQYTCTTQYIKYNNKNLIYFDPLTIDLNGRTVTINETEIKLTAKEFDLLVLLAKYPNRVFTPQQIFNHLWDTYGLEEDLRTVMVHISNLRKKLEISPNVAKFIKTVRGVGYKFVPNVAVKV